MLHRSPSKRPNCLVRSFLNLLHRGQASEAVSKLGLLSRTGIRLPSKTLASLLQLCAENKSLGEGKCVHLHLKVTGFKRPGTLLSNHLIGMYMKCGKDIDARKVFEKMSVRNVYSWNNMLSGYVKLGMLTRARDLFDQMPEKDVVSWNTMVIGCAQSGDFYEALRFYRELRRSTIGYNEFSFAGVLSVCVKMRELDLTRQAHGQVLVTGFLSNVVLTSSIVDAYTKCGEMSSARTLFDEMPMKDILSWTTLISGYSKWGDMHEAHKFFDSMPEKNPVSWTALISGYARHGLGNKALELFAEMMSLGIKPDQFTLSSCLCASATMASLKHGKQAHAHLLRNISKPNTIVIGSLIDMYSKCGALEIGEQVFDLIDDKKDPILWNTLISALAHHGHGEKALKMLDNMIESGVHLNRTTLVVVLNACSHSGLVKEGLRYFETMTTQHNIAPDQEHYACLIDLLGRAGCFDELINQIGNMPIEPDERVWNALLGVCRIHGNLKLGKKAAQKLIALEPQSSAAYVLLSSIYAALGRWESVAKVRKIMEKRNVRKELAVSWVEVESKVHSFTVSDEVHPLKEEIKSTVEQLTALMEEDKSTIHIQI